MAKKRKYQEYQYIPGDLFVFPNGLQAIVMEVDEYNDATKVKALNPDPELGKVGWFQEGEDWVCMAYNIITAN